MLLGLDVVVRTNFMRALTTSASAVTASWRRAAKCVTPVRDQHGRCDHLPPAPALFPELAWCWLIRLAEEPQICLARLLTEEAGHVVRPVK